MTGALLWLAAAAAVEVPAGGSLAEALERARPGETVRLAPGTWGEAVFDAPAVAIEGAGAGRTILVAPEGRDGVRARGRLSLAGLTVVAGPERCALKVLGGDVALRDVALLGGSCGAFLDGGRLRGEAVDLRGGGYGLLLRDGEARLEGATLRGGFAGAAQIHGRLRLARAFLVGPSREAALSVASGEAELDLVLVLRPGAAGLAASYGGRIAGREVFVAGATESDGILGDCVHSLKGDIRLEGGELRSCGGAALEASGGTVVLDGVEAQGGSAGCLVLVDGARAELQGNRCTGRGPGLVATSGARATLRMNRWLGDPALWVDCGSGSRAEIRYGEEVREPCSGRR